MLDVQSVLTLKWFLTTAFALVSQFIQERDQPARIMPPRLIQAPGKHLPEDLNAPINARKKAVMLTAQSIREGMIKRFDPNFVYMREFPQNNPNFRREVLNRAIFDSLFFSHGDKGVIREVLTELKAREYPWIDLSLANFDLNWITGEKEKWLMLLINQLSAAQLQMNQAVKMENYPLPQSIWITTGTGIHPAYQTFTSSDLPKLRDESQYLNGNLQGFDLSTQYVCDVVRSTLENPPEQELRARFQRGESLGPDFFYTRLWEAVFLNVEKFQGNSTLLADALDILAVDYPEVVQAKPHILNDLRNIKRLRVQWFDNDVLPRLWAAEHPQPGQAIMPAGQNMPTVSVRLPKTAWIFKNPGPENIPEMTFGDFSLQKAENDLLRIMP